MVLGGVDINGPHLFTVYPHGRGLHSFPFPLNLSLLCPFPLIVPHITQPNPSRRCVAKVLKLSSNVSDVSRRSSS